MIKKPLNLIHVAGSMNFSGYTKRDFYRKAEIHDMHNFLCWERGVHLPANTPKWQVVKVFKQELDKMIRSCLNIR